MNLLRGSHQESSQSNVTNPLYHLSSFFFASLMEHPTSYKDSFISPRPAVAIACCN